MALTFLGTSMPVRLLLGQRAWQRASDEAARLLKKGEEAATREEGCAALLMGAVGGAVLLSFSSRSLVGVPIALAAAIGGVPLWSSALERREKKELAHEMPAVFRTLAMALSSGETLPQAIGYLGAHATGAAGRSFSRAALRMRCGMSIDEAVVHLREELDAPGVPLLSTALVITQRTGSPLRDLFEYSARLVEKQGEFERLLAVKTAQVRLSVRIVSLMPVVMVGGLSLLSPDFREGLATPAGMGALFVAGVMDATALVIIWRQLKGVM